jgi:hypothetical protein
MLPSSQECVERPRLSSSAPACLVGSNRGRRRPGCVVIRRSLGDGAVRGDHRDGLAGQPVAARTVRAGSSSGACSVGTETRAAPPAQAVAETHAVAGAMHRSPSMVTRVDIARSLCLRAAPARPPRRSDLCAISVRCIHLWTPPPRPQQGRWSPAGLATLDGAAPTPRVVHRRAGGPVADPRLDDPPPARSGHRGGSGSDIAAAVDAGSCLEDWRRTGANRAAIIQELARRVKAQTDPRLLDSTPATPDRDDPGHAKGVCRWATRWAWPLELAGTTYPPRFPHDPRAGAWSADGDQPPGTTCACPATALVAATAVIKLPGAGAASPDGVVSVVAGGPAIGRRSCSTRTWRLTFTGSRSPRCASRRPPRSGRAEDADLELAARTPSQVFPDVISTR